MIEVRTDDDIKHAAYNWIKTRAHINRPLQESDRHIAFLMDNSIKACLLFSDYDGHNIFVHLAMDTPILCQRRYIRMMFDYAFNQCKCNRMTAMCVDGYERNERLLKGVGFVKEGVIRQAMRVDDEFVDGALYGILKGECKWV